MRRYRKLLVSCVLVLACIILVSGNGRVRRYASALAAHTMADPPEDEAGGVEHFRDERGAPTVVIASRRVTEGTPYDDVDWSWAWPAALRSRFGPVTVRRPQDLNAANLATHNLLILSGSVASSPVPSLEPLFQAGGVLIVQAPGTQTVLGGFAVDGAPLWAHEISKVSDAALPAAAAVRMAGIPIHARFWHLKPLYDRGSTTAAPQPLIWLDGQPAAWLTRHGKGAVITLAFDMAAALTAWRQGIPQSDFTVVEKAGRVPLIVESDDLVMDPRMLQNETPCADLLVRAIVDTACDAGRIPADWPLPDGAPAALIVTHDDEALGPRPLQDILVRDRARGLEPTVFAVPTSTSSETWPTDVDLCVHWNRHLFGDLRRHSLSEQRQIALHHDSPQWTDASTCRLHYLDWGSRWDGPFRIMAGSGVVVDSSLGPNNGHGYLFGSGTPYEVLARDGLPLSVTEIPFEFQEDWGGGGEAAMLAVLERAIATDHTAIVTLTHAGNWLKTEAGTHAFDTLAHRARAAGAYVGNLSGLTPRAGRISSGSTAGNLRVSVNVEGAPAWIRVPDAAHLSAARIGRTVVPLRRLADGTVLVQVPVRRPSQDPMLLEYERPPAKP